MANIICMSDERLLTYQTWVQQRYREGTQFKESLLNYIDQEIASRNLDC